MAVRKITDSRQKDNRGHRMSIHKAGGRIGRSVSERYSPEFYQEIGHKMGRKVALERRLEYYKDFGRQGSHARWNEDYEEDEGYQRQAKQSHPRYAVKDEEGDERSSRSQYGKSQQRSARRGFKSYAVQEFGENYGEDEERGFSHKVQVKMTGQETGRKGGQSPRSSKQ